MMTNIEQLLNRFPNLHVPEYRQFIDERLGEILAHPNNREFIELLKWQCMNADIVLIMADTQPLCVYFESWKNEEWEKRKQQLPARRSMNGGIIYHSYNNGWSIHT